VRCFAVHCAEAGMTSAVIEPTRIEAAANILKFIVLSPPCENCRNLAGAM
jgi:hypothetical protein